MMLPEGGIRMNRIAIVCESLTGNTAMLAEALRAHLQSKNSYVTSPVLADADSSDVFFIGSWTDKGDCAAATAAFLKKLHNKDVFLFGTCGFGKSDAYYDTVYRRFADHLDPDNRIIGHYICQGKMPESVLHRYKAMKAANPESNRWDESIENYHNALSHPNGNDMQALCDAADEALETIKAKL